MEIVHKIGTRRGRGKGTSSSVYTGADSDSPAAASLLCNPASLSPADVIESRYGSSRRKTWIKYDAYVAPNPVLGGIALE